MRSPDYSVVICTRNRAEILRWCLDALAADPFDRGRFEVIVVDNGSTDGTPAVLEEETRLGRLPLKAIREPAPGVCRARNRAISAGQGGYFLFLDDDALAAPDWLSAFDAHIRLRGSEIVQGRIWTRFLSPPPAWFDEAWLPRLGHLDLGEEVRPFDAHFHSGNLAVARSVFDKAGGFREDLGPGASGLGDDTEFGIRALDAGFSAVYEPKACVHHLVPPERVMFRAFLRRFYTTGRAQPLFRRYSETRVRTALYFIRATFGRAGSVLRARTGKQRMAALCDEAEHWGRVVTLMRHDRD
jgi:glycosyltransferase involved in cell wall biosynthesis